MQTRTMTALLLGISAYGATSRALESETVPGGLIEFNDNGAWSWFEDERAIVDTRTGQLLVSSVSDSSGTGGRDGDVDVVSYRFADGRLTRFTLNADMVADDHNSAALLVLPDGRYLAAYANHGTDHLTRFRLSSRPGDATAWQPEVTHNNGVGTTYNNLHQLSAEDGRIYNFTRTVGWDPNYLVSDDDGQTWTYGGRVLDAPGRPYAKYTSNGVDTIHMLNTEQHPRNFDNSVYHRVIRDGKVYDSFGTQINTLDGQGIDAATGTRVFAGDADHVAWVSDIHLDDAGRPFIAFTVQRDSAGLPKGQGGEDLRYHYARFDGTQWNEHEIAFAGTRLYAGEDDYTGNIALDPNNPDIVYISTNADPVTAQPLISDADGQRHYEIYKGTTTDRGATWTWQPVTADSSVDHIRPIIPAWDTRHTAVLWLRGVYTDFKNYDLKVVGIILETGE